MFDAVKFNGDKITEKDFDENIECKQIIGIYQVKLQFDEDGKPEYTVTSEEPTGKLILFQEENVGNVIAMYLGNDVETSSLVDLL